MLKSIAVLCFMIVISILPADGVAQSTLTSNRPGMPLVRSGDEIVVCGQLFHTGTPVVLWMDAGGYDAYRLEKHFPTPPATRPASGPTSRPWQRDTLRPRYSQRKSPLTDEEVELTRNGNWTLPLLQDKVDQFVLHYDVAGLSRTCF